MSMLRRLRPAQPLGEVCTASSRRLMSGSSSKLYAGMTFWTQRTPTLKITPLPPTWEQVPQIGGLRVKRPGTLLFSFYCADRGRNGIGLGVSEVAQLVRPGDPKAGHVFRRGGLDQGYGGTDSFFKTLTIEPSAEDSYAFVLSVDQGHGSPPVEMQHTMGLPDFTSVILLSQWVLPHLVGWNEVFARGPAMDPSDNGGFGHGTSYDLYDEDDDDESDSYLGWKP